MAKNPQKSTASPKAPEQVENPFVDPFKDILPTGHPDEPLRAYTADQEIIAPGKILVVDMTIGENTPATEILPPQVIPEPPPPADPEATIRLDGSAFADMRSLGADVMSDEPPEDMRVSPLLTAERDRRRSLLEDANSARRAQGLPPLTQADLDATAHVKPVPRPGSWTGEPEPQPTPAPPAETGSHRFHAALQKGTAPTVEWRSRVQVAAAFQFDGNVGGCPDFIDRNWHAYDRTKGVCLNIPNVGVVGVGEYVVSERILDDRLKVVNQRLRILSEEQFRELYVEAPLAQHTSDRDEVTP